MEEPRSTRHLKRAELAGASTAPTAPKRRRIAFDGGAPLELRSEERGGGPLLLLQCSDSPEKVSAPSEAGDFVSSSSSGPSEPPRSSGRSDEDSVDVVKEKKFDMVGDDRQQQAKSFETEASTCDRDFSCSRETTPSERRPSAAETPSRGELESFFSAAEECERQRFAEKYNYDVAMDAPSKAGTSGSA